MAKLAVIDSNELVCSQSTKRVEVVGLYSISKRASRTSEDSHTSHFNQRKYTGNC